MHWGGRWGFWRSGRKGHWFLRAKQVQQVALFLLHVAGNDSGTIGGRGGGPWGLQRWCRRRRRRSELFLLEGREEKWRWCAQQPCRGETCRCRSTGRTFTGAGFTSLSLARASFLGSLLFHTNRPGDLWTTSQMPKMSFNGKKKKEEVVANSSLLHYSRSPPRISGCLQTEQQARHWVSVTLLSFSFILSFDSTVFWFYLIIFLFSSIDISSVSKD